jgi:hypothetical protein
MTCVPPQSFLSTFIRPHPKCSASLCLHPCQSRDVRDQSGPRCFHYITQCVATSCTPSFLTPFVSLISTSPCPIRVIARTREFSMFDYTVSIIVHNPHGYGRRSCCPTPSSSGDHWRLGHAITAAMVPKDELLVSFTGTGNRSFVRLQCEVQELFKRVSSDLIRARFPLTFHNVGQ